MKFRNLLTVAFLMLTVNIQADPLGENPFGFKMGMSEEEIKAMEGVTVDTSRTWRMGKHNVRLVILSKAPHPHPPFDNNFHLYISKKHGLFKILAWSSKIEIGQGGQNIMSKYVEIREQLVKRYKGFRRSAYIEGGASWETPTDWTTRVLKKNPRKDLQVFFSEWSPYRAERSEQIGSIDLSIFVNSPVNSNFCLTFGFTNSFQAMWGD